jgi:hypothetical protein
MNTVEDFAGQEDFDTEGWDEYRSALQDRYRFYIMNPPHQRGVEYSLWMQEEGYEWPILSSNTGGFATFLSREKTVGDGIEPTEEFLNLLGLAFHEAMCFMPDIYFRDDHFERRYMSIYDDKPREYEVWAAQVLLNWMVTGEKLIPEFEPLARWAGKHTEFGVPVLDGDQELPEGAQENEDE